MNTRQLVRAAALAPALAVVILALAVNVSAKAKPKLDPESAKFYQSARLIMTKEEDRIFTRLPDAESRKEFIADFWIKRDPDPDTPDNEYKREFDARVDFVNKRFNKEGGPAINTDRGRIYIFMGPPDKVDEFQPQLPQLGQAMKGATIWWVYYAHELGVEFTDRNGTGKYVITNYSGDFFGAMDIIKLGRDIRADDVFAKKFVKFQAAYDPKTREIDVRLPTKSLMFRENDEGRMQIDLRFIVYIYPSEGAGKEVVREARSVVLTDAEYEARKTVDFRFAKPLPSGSSFVDVIVMGKEGQKGKIRQIFELKAPRS